MPSAIALTFELQHDLTSRAVNIRLPVALRLPDMVACCELRLAPLE